jgi:hypothetical protein
MGWLQLQGTGTLSVLGRVVMNQGQHNPNSFLGVGHSSICHSVGFTVEMAVGYLNSERYQCITLETITLGNMVAPTM